MAFNFFMPDIGEGVVEGEVVSWKVKEGDKVKLDQPLVEVMTDKATVELPSPRAGTIAKINFKEGDICPVGKVLVVIEEDGATASATPAPVKAEPAAPPAQPAARPARPTGGQPAQVVQAGSAAPAPVSASGAIQVVDATATRQRVLATPATRRLARQLGIEIGKVPPTGKHGRVTTEDVRGFRGAAEAPTAAYAVSDGNGGPAVRQAYAPIAIAKAGPDEEERIPLRGMRKRIAES